MPKSAEDQQVCNFFKKPVNRKNLRKRAAEEEDNEEDSKNESCLLHIQKKQVKLPENKLYFSTGPSKNSAYKVQEEPENKLFRFESSKEIQVQHDNRATAILETETQFYRTIRERALKLKGKGASCGEEKDYKDGFRREEKAGGAHGPLSLRASSAYIRVSARFDYEADICKDYEETAYCGYGIPVKFMHDRGDFKSGWQL